MRKIFILSLLAMMIAWGIGGCGGGSEGTSADPLGTNSLIFGHKNDVAGTDWSMAMEVGPKGTVVLTAKIKNASGTPVAGREVTFGFKSNQSGATINASKVNTDAAGEATIIYTAGTVSGFDIVHASISNGAQMDANITVVSPTGGRQIALTASPTSLASGQSSILTATVTDGDSKPVSGEVVTFSFVGGAAPSGATLAALNGGVTGVNGQASAVYTAGSANFTQNVQDTVQATVKNASEAVILTRTGSGGGGNQIAITPPPTTTLLAGESSTLTAMVTDSVGEPVLGQSVTFVLFSDNSGATLKTLNGTATDTTDASGKVTAIYTAGASNPTLNVQDTVKAGIVGASTAIIMTRTGSGGGGGSGGVTMNITANPLILSPGQLSVITAKASYADGSGVVGQTVNFGFVIKNSNPPPLKVVRAVTDSNGEALAIYTAGNSSPGISIQDAVTANMTAASGTYSAGAQIITVTPPAAAGTGNRINLTASTNTPVSIITATVTRDDGSVLANETVSFTFIFADGAYFFTPETVNTDTNGKAYVTMRGGVAGRVTIVRATIGTPIVGDTAVIIAWL